MTAWRIDCAPAVIEAGSHGLLVSEWVGGGDLRREFRPQDTVEVARLLSTLHTCGLPWSGMIDPLARLDLYLSLARPTEGPAAATAEDLRRLRPALIELAEHLAATPAAVGPCHGDPWPGNLVGSARRMWLIDWEYSGVGDQAWDLATFALEAGLDTAATSDLISAYYSAGGAAEVTEARVAAQMPLCDAVWSAWGLLQNAHRGGSTDFVDYSARRIDHCRRRLRALSEVSPISLHGPAG